MINFPDSPSLNQTYTFNGLTWQWNGSAWISIGSGITQYVSTFNGFTGAVTGTSIPKHWLI